MYILYTLTFLWRHFHLSMPEASSQVPIRMLWSGLDAAYGFLHNVATCVLALSSSHLPEDGFPACAMWFGVPHARMRVHVCTPA